MNKYGISQLLKMLSFLIKNIHFNMLFGFFILNSFAEREPFKSHKLRPHKPWICSCLYLTYLGPFNLSSALMHTSCISQFTSSIKQQCLILMKQLMCKNTFHSSTRCSKHGRQSCNDLFPKTWSVVTERWEILVKNAEEGG